MTPPPTTLYLSPHLDDAVFSCAGRIRQDHQRGRRVVVATLFSGCTQDQAQAYAIRKAEDRQALAMLQAEAVHLDLLDAPWRRPFYNGFRRIVLDRHSDDDLTFVNKLATRIESLRQQVQPDLIVAPLAIGTHIDHRLVFEASRLLPIPVHLEYYEERPYVFTDCALQARLAELGYKISISPSECAKRYCIDLVKQAYVKTYLPPSMERNQCLALIRQRLTSSTGSKKCNSQVFDFNQDGYDNVSVAVSAYSSQLPDFFGSTECYRQQTAQYTDTISSAAYAERYWNL